jgi:hypothetical protein
VVGWTVSSSSNPLLDLIVNLAGTLVGVFAAFILAISYQRYKDQQREKEERTRVMKAVKAELLANRQIMDSKGKPFIEGWRIFSRVALDSAVNSGKFELLDSDIQSKIADTYLMLDTTAMYAREYYQLLPSGQGIVKAEDARRQEVNGYVFDAIGKAGTLIQESISLIDAKLPKAATHTNGNRDQKPS